MRKNASKMNIEATCVYKKNFTAAYTRPSAPQIPTKKYMGMSVSSQKIKNHMKFVLIKTPKIAPEKKIRSEKYAACFFTVQLESATRISSMEVSKSIITLKRSTCKTSSKSNAFIFKKLPSNM